MKNKLRGGFSYMEILIALSLFSIMLVAVLPSLLHAGRNMEFAQTYYQGHLNAQRIMLVARDAVWNGNDPEDVVREYVNDSNIGLYSVWIFGEGKTYFSAYGAPSVEISFTSELVPAEGYTIIVATWNEYGNMTGRAIGVANFGVGE